MEIYTGGYSEYVLAINYALQKRMEVRNGPRIVRATSMIRKTGELLERSYKGRSIAWLIFDVSFRRFRLEWP